MHIIFAPSEQISSSPPLISHHTPLFAGSLRFESVSCSLEVNPPGLQPVEHLLKVVGLVLVVVVLVVAVLHADGGALRDGALLGRDAPARVRAGQLALHDLRLLVDAQTLHALLLWRLLVVPVGDRADITALN